MSFRERTFRIAVRKFDAFESAIAAQWADFESRARTGLTLETVPMELAALEHALFGDGSDSGMRTGAWDVCFVATDWIAAMHAGNHATDLAPLLARDPPGDYPQGWSSSLLRLQRIGNSVLGVPYHDGPECLIYRRDLFDDPINRRRYEDQFHRPLAPPSTWEEFHRLSRFFQAPAERRFGTVFAAFPDGHNSVYDFLLQLWTRGGDLFNGSSTPGFHSPAAVAALTFYRGILNDANAVHPESRALDSVGAGLRFAAGEAALMINWFGFATHAHTAPDSKVRGLVDVGDIPSAPPGQSVSLNVYWILALAAGSPHPDVAWQFLRHTQTPAMDKLTTTHGAIGCRKSTWHDADVNAAVPFYRRMEQLHTHAREIPQLAAWPRIAAIIDELVTAAINSDAPIPDLLERADAQAAAL